jgi:hypothetical protein
VSSIDSLCEPQSMAMGRHERREVENFEAALEYISGFALRLDVKTRDYLYLKSLTDSWQLGDCPAGLAL